MTFKEIKAFLLYKNVQKIYSRIFAFEVNLTIPQLYAKKLHCSTQCHVLSIRFLAILSTFWMPIAFSLNSYI